MRWSPSPIVVLLGALCLVATAAAAQSLGELAAQEKEKRKQQGQKPAKTFTEADLAAAKGRTTSMGTAEVAAEAKPATDTKAAGTAPKEKSEDELRAEAEKSWRDRLQKAQQSVDKLAAEADQIQLSLNDLGVNQYGQGRTAAMSRLEEVKTQLAAARQQVADLQEEGRRNSWR